MIIRKLDGQGRIVVPIEMRKYLQIAECGEMSIELVGDSIIIKNVANSLGCDYCNKTHPEDGADTNLWFGNKLHVFLNQHIEVNNCPMCGRKLFPKDK